MSDSKIKCKYFRIQYKDDGSLMLVKSKDCKQCDRSLELITSTQKRVGDRDRKSPLHYAVVMLDTKGNINDIVIPVYYRRNPNNVDHFRIEEFKSILGVGKLSRMEPASVILEKVEQGKYRKIPLCFNHWQEVLDGKFNVNVDNPIPGIDYESESVHARCFNGSHI